MDEQTQTWEQDNPEGNYEYEQPQSEYDDPYRDDDEAESVTWRQARRTLIAYMIVIVALMLGNAFLVGQRVQAQLLAMPNMPRIPDGLGNIALPLLYLQFALNGLISVIVLMLQYGVMHLIATRLVDGVGTYSGLVYRVTIPLVSWIAFSGVVTLVVNHTTTLQMYAAMQQSPGTFMTPFSNSTFVIGNLFILASAIPFLIWICRRIAYNYNFGWNRGCATVLAWLGVMAVLAIGCYFTLFIGIFAQFSSMLQTLPAPPLLQY
jgi:hypothetical protein